ncbi:1479_t:CDS:2, partial [Ambispora leptoticha]
MSERKSLLVKVDKWFKKEKNKISGVKNPYPSETKESQTSKSKNNESETLTPDLVTGKMSNIYAEIARLKLNTEQ